MVRTATKRVGENVVALREDSISDPLHRLLKEYGDEDVDTILIAWRRKNKDGSKFITTDFYGWPSDAFGLLEFLKDRIRDVMWDM